MSKQIKTSKIEFKEHHGFTKSLDKYISMLVADGYSDREILKWVFTMVLDMIMIRGKK